MTKPADYVINNASGSAVRSDLNDLFEAIRQNNGYGSEPTQKYNYMWYANTSSDRMSFYKANASDRVEFVSLTDGNFFGPNGSASNPSYTFTNSTSTGFYRSASNEIGVSNAGATTAQFKPNQIEVDGNLVLGRSSADTQIQIHATGVGHGAILDLAAHASTYSDYGLRLERQDGINAVSKLEHRGTADFEIKTTEESDIVFHAANSRRLSLTGAGNNEGSLISHNISRSATDASGYAFINSPSNNGAGFDGCCLVKDATGLGTVLFLNRLTGAGTGNLIEFEYNNAAVGVITTNGSSTTYHPNSDYRLKQDVVNIDNAITKIKSLRPVTFRWKNNPDLGYDNGFIAHEVQETGHFNHIVTGIKDGTKKSYSNPELDVPDYQGVDYSKFTPMLVAALQEAVAKIETLEAKVAVLEGS
tara:strand:+ start:472 stop:1722 length:1251 start_codon:yes stop_codon:yes gene_type:complete